jgi:hypothetical protein
VFTYLYLYSFQDLGSGFMFRADDVFVLAFSDLELFEGIRLCFVNFCTLGQQSIILTPHVLSEWMVEVCIWDWYQVVFMILGSELVFEID